MNYRHAFHAGNFADVTKHALLVRILVHLLRKDAPFRVVDTHAGIGRYDLAGPEAERTGEWRGGIGRLDEPFGEDVETLLAPYRAVLEATRARYGRAVYPGSPAIVRELIRPGDRAVFVEKHPADADTLTGRFNETANAKVLRLDGWTALGGLIPPKERRGLVLIDPPFEESGETGHALARLAAALRKWATGIFALWYPIKRGPGIDGPLARFLASLDREALRLELLVADPATRDGLAGSGLLVVNPPWTLAEEAGALLPALAGRLAQGPGAGSRCETVRAAGPSLRR